MTHACARCYTFKHTHTHIFKTQTHTKQEGLIGTAKEGARDTRVRTMLHKQWQEEQDTKDVRQLLHGIQNGFRKPAHGLNGLDDMVGVCFVVCMYVLLFACVSVCGCLCARVCFVLNQ